MRGGGHFSASGDKFSAAALVTTASFRSESLGIMQPGGLYRKMGTTSRLPDPEVSARVPNASFVLERSLLVDK